MTAVTIRLTEEEANLAREFAVQERRTLADAFRVVFFERLEDEYDLRDLRAAKLEWQKDPVTHTHEEVLEELGLNG